jgi:hypothetical protein
MIESILGPLLEYMVYGLAVMAMLHILSVFFERTKYTFTSKEQSHVIYVWFGGWKRAYKKLNRITNKPIISASMLGPYGPVDMTNSMGADGLDYTREVKL